MSINIRLDIVPLEKNYRGIERTFSADQFAFIKNKKEFNFLLEKYYNYLDYTFNRTFNIDEFFNMILSFSKELLKNHIQFEIIIFDTEIIKKFDIFDVKYLGIDIVNENSESLLKEPNAELIKIHLNKNGLCKNVDSVDLIKNILKFDLQDFKWTAYYVYCLQMNTLDGSLC